MYLPSKKHHYHDVVEKDLVLTECLEKIRDLPRLSRIDLEVRKVSDDENHLVSCLGALYIITGQKPCFIRKIRVKKGEKKKVTGGIVTLRGDNMYNFILKLSYKVLPHVGRFDGLGETLHESEHSYSFKDAFVFDDLSSLVSHFESLRNFRCKFYYKTIAKNEMVKVAHGLQICLT